MAKAKKFNIETFVEDAAEGVHVAQQQRQKEEEEQKQKEVEALQRQEEENRRREEELKKQKEEEELAKATEIAAQQLLAQQIANQQLAAQQLAAQQLMSQQMTTPYMPIQNNIGMTGVGEAQPLMKEDESQKSKRGRRKSLRTIERVNGKIVYLEKEMDANLARLSTFERFDKQDIIRTALYQWMAQHFDGMMLDNDGRREVIEYIQRTTTMEDI